MMRLPLPADRAFRSGERRSDLARAGALAGIALLLALRIYCALTLTANSDEPQHLHVVWAWTEGLLPYRDVFDNHAPLFQLLGAPLLAWFGERADIVPLITSAVPLRNDIADEESELARVLRLTRPDDYVMDAKGEMIFRHRPVYGAMENITVARMRDGSIPDGIAGRLAETGTPVVIMDRLPPADAAFVERNYQPVGPADGLIRVAGQALGEARAGEPIAFDIAVPADYEIVKPDGAARGTLDGLAYAGDRRLAAGRHTFVASADSRLALVWAPALKRGLGERELFAATGR